MEIPNTQLSYFPRCNVFAREPSSFSAIDNNMNANFEENTKLQMDFVDYTSPSAVYATEYLPHILNTASIFSVLQRIQPICSNSFKNAI